MFFNIYILRITAPRKKTGQCEDMMPKWNAGMEGTSQARHISKETGKDRINADSARNRVLRRPGAKTIIKLPQIVRESQEEGGP